MYGLDVFLAGGQCRDVVHEAGPDSHTDPPSNPLLVRGGQVEVELVCLDGGRVAEVEDKSFSHQMCQVKVYYVQGEGGERMEKT